MRRKEVVKLINVAVAVLVVLAVSGCCGPGTIKKPVNGRTVCTVEEVVICGGGTELQDGKCVAAL